MDIDTTTWFEKRTGSGNWYKIGGGHKTPRRLRICP
jgi:hypothetical protein